MSQRSPILGWAALWLAAVAVDAGEERRAPARVYTNEDLSRVSLRDGKTPSPAPSPAALPAPIAPAADGPREAHWRAEAERVRRRVEPWRDEATVLRGDI